MTEPPQRLGKGMITAAWVLLLGLLTLFFNDLLDKQHNPNRDPLTTQQEDGARTVVLQRNRDGHYVAAGTINGVSVDFLLDTGATTVSVPARIARELNLKKGPQTYTSTANGTIITYATRLDRVTLGNITLRRVRAHINPHMEQAEILLGMSFLKYLEFTQRGNKLILRQYR
ncbi:MAG: TIGR02281 family clan AA aspartic protease [Gammaproteobacteria bacterium]|nr:TIGR02281 family clan AA aspartic protease [Gammaproteobacteria bacterium]